MSGFFGCLGTLATAIFVLLTVVLPVSAFVRASRLSSGLRAAQKRLDQMETLLAELRREFVAAHPSTPPPQVDADDVTYTRQSAAEIRQPAPTPDTTAVTVASPALAVPSDAPTMIPPPLDVATPPVRPADGPQPPVGTASGSSDTLETTIGGRWLLYFGIVVLLLGVGFFVKYAFDNSWVTESARVLLGAAFGLGLVAAGHRFTKSGYEYYGHLVSGSGFVSVYIAGWAATSVYGLVEPAVGFVLLCLTTAGAALMADRLRSRALALVAVLGGYVTPGLVGDNHNAQVMLLTYISVLSVGAAVIADRQGWPWLTNTSYGLSLATFAVWALDFYTPSAYVVTQFFICLLGVIYTGAYWKTWRDWLISQPVVAVAGIASVVLPFHGASTLNLFAHSLPLLLYLVVFTLAGVAASVQADRAWIRLLVFLATVPTLLLWLDTHLTAGWRVAAVATAVAVYVMHTAAQVEKGSRRTTEWPASDLVLFHLNALALFAVLYRVLDACVPAATPILALGLGAWQAVVAWRARAWTSEGSANALAASFAMVGFAIGLQFDDWWALVGWALEGAALYWAGVRTGRSWLRVAAVGGTAAVVARMLTLDYFATPAGFVAFTNPRAGASLAVVAGLYAMAALRKRSLEVTAAAGDRERGLLLVAANVLTVIAGSAEIGSYWHLRRAEDATAALWHMASLSVVWGVYGTALLLVGITRRVPWLRRLAVGFLLVTVGKVLLVDLSQLGGVYRIVGFLGLGFCLLLGAWLYQRFRQVILGDGHEPPSA